MAVRAAAVGRPWRRLMPAALWERPRRLQHEWQPGHPDQPIQMENPYKEPPKKCVLCGINVDYKNVQACATRSRRKFQKPLKELMYLDLCQLCLRTHHFSQTPRYVMSNIQSNIL
ncbi:small ribosomal subunit protein bS18m isoform X2 [Balearica regulorum gibbericeps]|uniref:small ribosomal subunit protein bS18m isoform X2 n=1 Tax=Balearica regulorum gibbericeps TaxID=100784 RepID=UPI003F60266B